MSSAEVAVAKVKKTRVRKNGKGATGKAEMYLPPKGSKFSDVVEIPEGKLLTSPAYFEYPIHYAKTRRAFLVRKYEALLGEVDKEITRLEGVPLEEQAAAQAREKVVASVEASSKRIQSSVEEMDEQELARAMEALAASQAVLQAALAKRAMSQ